MNELTQMSAGRLAAAIKCKQVSARQVLAAHLERTVEVNGRLNGVVQLAAVEAQARAAAADEAIAHGEYWGPLHGVPVTIKDVFDTAGLISTAGTQGRSAYCPQADAVAVARLKAAGAIVLGKTNTPELSLAFETDNSVYGRTNNPYDLERSAGGSSGGEAATIAACASPLGLGTDIAGSLRVPSHFCGIAAIKPTRGRVPRTGTFPPALGLLNPLYHVGPLARSVDDLALALPILAGPDGYDPTIGDMPLRDPRSVDLGGLRVAFYTNNGIVPVSDDTASAVQRAARSLAEAGAMVEEARPEGIEQSFELMARLLAADGGAGMQMLLGLAGTTEPSLLLQQISVVLAPYAAHSTAEFAGLLLQFDVFQSTMAAFLGRYDAIVCPVTAFPSIPHGASFAPEYLPGFSYTMTYNLTGWPATVVRGGQSSGGLPVGVQVVAGPWREDISLAVAKRIEEASAGWRAPAL